MITVNTKLFKALIAFNVLFIMSAMSFFAFGFNKTPDVITAKEFRVIDDKGNVAVTIRHSMECGEMNLHSDCEFMKGDVIITATNFTYYPSEKSKVPHMYVFSSRLSDEDKTRWSEIPAISYQP